MLLYRMLNGRLGRTLITSLLLCLPFIGQAEALRARGQIYGYWGWNNADYSDSNIHFRGNGNDFTLYDVQAKDRQTTFSSFQLYHTYLNPGRITIAQYDWRIGYFVADNWAVSLGFDHMKYVMVQDQTVDISGTIVNPGFERPDPTRGQQQLTGDFLTFEHTDGLNMISLETEYFLPLWNLGNEFDFALFTGAGAGIMYPKSNVKLLSGQRNDEWHVAGYATSIKFGAETTLWHNYFIRILVKYGYVDMDDILTSNKGDKASQTFYFDEYIGAFGYRF